MKVREQDGEREREKDGKKERQMGRFNREGNSESAEYENLGQVTGRCYTHGQKNTPLSLKLKCITQLLKYYLQTQFNMQRQL